MVLTIHGTQFAQFAIKPREGQAFLSGELNRSCFRQEIGHVPLRHHHWQGSNISVEFEDLINMVLHTKLFMVSYLT